jgi:hypothetical protein
MLGETLQEEIDDQYFSIFSYLFVYFYLFTHVSIYLFISFFKTTIAGDWPGDKRKVIYSEAKLYGGSQIHRLVRRKIFYFIYLFTHLFIDCRFHRNSK